MTRIVAVTTILAATVAVGWYTYPSNPHTSQPSVKQTPDASVHFPVGSRPAAPLLSGQLLDATAFRLGDWAGSVVVVNFWASWCAPCNDEAPELQAFVKATSGLNVHMLGVNIHDERSPAKAFVAHYNLTYPNLFDPDGKTLPSFPAISMALPNTVVLDRDGRVAAAFRRKVTALDLESAVQTLLSEPSP
ncbi:effector protein [Rugosimonospora africana]|uniref:Effector protein n=1 Tax=Rugosimonospora africana TaxID=556532 RepID=A0A8J3VSA9_9ACTN|nr:effector protein [Rugosimonospora africana]